MSGSTLEMVTQYLDSGMIPLPVPKGSKNPGRTGWQKERVTKEELPEKFRNGSNVGLLLGDPSNDLIDVDLDTPEAVFLAPYILPKTEMVSGRPSSRDSHLWYRGKIKTR